MRESLAVLQHAEFDCGVDRYIGIGPDSEATASRDEQRGGKNSVTQVGLRHGTQPDHGARADDAAEFGVVDVRRVHQAPALIDL